MLLCLLSALLWSSLDLLRKQLVRELSSLQLAFFLASGQSILFAFWVSWSRSQISYPGLEYLLPAGISLLFGATGFYLYLNSVARGALSLTIPLLSLTPVVAALAAMTIESSLHWTQWIGLIVISLGGLVLRGSSPQRHSSGDPMLSNETFAQALMVGAAICWGINTVFDKIALRALSSISNPAALHGLLLTTAAAVIYSVAYFRAEPNAAYHKREAVKLPLIILTVLVAQAALATQLLAIQQVPVGLFEGLKRSVGVCSAIVVGSVFFNEMLTGKKLLAGVLMVSGLWMLYYV